MRGSKKAGPVKRRVMRNGGTAAKKAGPVKRMSGGAAKKAGPVKKRSGGTAAKKAGPVKKLRGGGMTVKKMRSGGRNLRDEEARVIGVQDNAADEMRRVKARRPNDAAERMDKRSQESRVGSRERNAREEMTRLRREAAGMGMKVGGQATSPLTSQHKRYAMTGTTKLAKGGRAPMSTKIKETKAPKRAPATTGVNLNMGSPKTETIKARGMGAAIRGGNFRTNT